MSAAPADPSRYDVDDPAGGRQDLTRLVRADPQMDALAMLGHDVAGPLTAIILSAELGLEDLEDAGAGVAVVRRRLHTILRQAHHLDELREDVLVVAAADAGAIEARPVEVEVAPFLWTAAELVTPRVRLDVQAPADLRCRVQPGHLRQMLANLVSNAVKHAGSAVTLTAVEAFDRVLVTVRDDGPGVAAEVAPRLFRRFAHVGADRRPAKAGSGLGLYIVQTLAQANGGSVLYWPGEPGARFTLSLPAAGVPDGTTDGGRTAGGRSAGSA